jgi:hypothetical protein
MYVVNLGLELSDYLFYTFIMNSNQWTDLSFLALTGLCYVDGKQHWDAIPTSSEYLDSLQYTARRNSWLSWRDSSRKLDLRGHFVSLSQRHFSFTHGTMWIAITRDFYSYNNSQYETYQETLRGVVDKEMCLTTDRSNAGYLDKLWSFVL